MPISSAGVHRPARLSEERRNVAARAVCLAVEDELAARGRLGVEAALGRLGCHDRQLIEMQRRELCGDEIGIVADVPVLRFRGDGELPLVAEPRIEERAFATHLRIGDVCVPMRHRTPAGIGVIVYASHTEGRREQSSGRLAVGAKRFAVVQQFSVVLPWSPGEQGFLELLARQFPTDR